MTDETMAKLAWAAIGAALDCGATTEQIVRTFSADIIVKIIDDIRREGKP